MKPAEITRETRNPIPTLESARDDLERLRVRERRLGASLRAGLFVCAVGVLLWAIWPL